MFVGPDLLWYRTETAGCVGPESQPQLYDVATGTAADSDIQFAWSIWPGTSSR